MSSAPTQVRGELLVTLSNRIVAIYKELYGKGPVKVRCWYLDDVVLCVLRDPLTKSEETFVALGRGDRVALQRDTFHEIAAPVFRQAVEDVTGRSVDTVLSATEEEKNVSTLVFLLESPDLAALDATEEGLKRERKQVRKKAADVRAESAALRGRQRDLVEEFETNRRRD